jgi:hypothetical protein
MARPSAMCDNSSRIVAAQDSLAAALRAGYPIVPNGAVSINKPLIIKHLMNRENSPNQSDFSLL